MPFTLKKAKTLLPCATICLLQHSLSNFMKIHWVKLNSTSFSHTLKLCYILCPVASFELNWHQIFKDVLLGTSLKNKVKIVLLMAQTDSVADDKFNSGLKIAHSSTYARNSSIYDNAHRQGSLRQIKMRSLGIGTVTFLFNLNRKLCQHPVNAL